MATDAEGRLIYWNRAAETLLGFEANEVLGRLAAEVVPDLAKHALLNGTNRRIGPGERWTGDFQLRHRYGSRFPARLTVFPFSNQNEGISGVVAIVLDETETYQANLALRESREHYHSLFGGMLEGVALHEMILDEFGRPRDYRIVEVNPAFERILGLTRDSVVDHTATEAYGVTEAPFIEEFYQVVKTGIPQSFEKTFLPLGRRFSISVSPWGQGGFATIFSDTTEQAKHEEVLRASEAQARALSTQNELLLREVNHRVQNNLTALAGLLHMELRNLRQRKLDECIAPIEDIIGKVEGLARIHTMLSSMRWSSISLPALCEAMVTSAFRLLPANVRADLDVSPSNVLIKPEKASPLGLIIHELASNIARHASVTQNHLKISITFTEDQNSVKIRFRDNGPGYPENVLQGTDSGVGSYLIRTIVKHDLGGVLDLSNDGGAVTIFTLNRDRCIVSNKGV